MDEITLQVDEYERWYGRTDRSDFDGDFYVPTEVRNRINSAKGSLRIHGGLLTISRSRTFLSLSNNSRSSIHSSTPDLSSRSVPNTPGSNHKISLTSSYDSVLEENEENGAMTVNKRKEKNKKKNGKSHHSSLHHIFSSNSEKTRRKSEDILEARSSNSNHSALLANNQQLIPRVKKSGFNENLVDRSNILSTQQEAVNNSEADSNSPARWGNVRGSNSFAGDLSISSLSTYTIPRVSLSQHKIEVTDPTHDSSQNLPKKWHPGTSTFLMRHNTDDSVA